MELDLEALGSDMYSFAKELFPICRSLTGNGVRQTLKMISGQGLNLKIHEVKSGEKCFDWTVPQEWNIEDAWIIGPDGEKIVDFKKNNLHCVGYSIPIDAEVPLAELQKHLFSLENQPDAIPYVTSYYKPIWGFCLTDRQRKQLKEGIYKVHIGSTLSEGSLTYGELFIPGKSEKEILLSTYVCHPSMANNEISGPVLTTFLAKRILSQQDRKYSYRIVFAPETLGAITYISRNLEALKKNLIA